MANSLPEVKWEKWPPEHLPDRVFAFFCDVSRCHAICIFLTRGGDCHMKGAGNFKLNPLRRPTWAWANLFGTPKRDHFVTIFFRY